MEWLPIKSASDQTREVHPGAALGNAQRAENEARGGWHWLDSFVDALSLCYDFVPELSRDMDGGAILNANGDLYASSVLMLNSDAMSAS